MNEEWLSTFTEGGRYIGIAKREDVHKFGFWHQTFHCWLITMVNNQSYILFQKRHSSKKNHPNKWDISGAGHILAGEKIVEGVRELNEELGIVVLFNELISLGLYRSSQIIENSEEKIIDNEFCHVFLSFIDEPLDEFQIQIEEVSGLALVSFDEFCSFITSDKEKIKANGFCLNEQFEKEPFDSYIWKNDFVPHHSDYWDMVIKGMKKQLF